VVIGAQDSEALCRDLEVKDDTIPVRADERFDEERLANYLDGMLPGTENKLGVRQFGGGAANLTYLLDYGSHQYVLRRPPLGPIAPTSHDMGREHKVLSVLHEAFPYAPRSYLYCDDSTVIGAPFHIMRRCTGTVVRTRIPEEYEQIHDAPRQMSLALVDALADFHAVDYERLGLAGIGRPEGFIKRQIDGWHRRWMEAKAEDVPEMDVLHTWLNDYQPSSRESTLVHNDFKLDNTMFDPSDPGRVVAVLDWDMCTLGDPLSDLGALLTYWTESTDPPPMQAAATSFMPVGDDRFPTRAELVSRYATRSGRDVAEVHFYHILGLYRVIVIVAQIFIRFKRGQTQDRRFASFGLLVKNLAQSARTMI
jgi:aminoglycoside phosphotransferase (APT) family kinase protein